MARLIACLLLLGFVMGVGALGVTELWGQAGAAPTAAEIQLQVVEGSRKQCEQNLAALFVDNQALRKQVAELTEAAAKQAKPEEKK